MQQTINNNYGHLQPQAPDVERAVLGELMIDRDAYAVVSEILCPESFYEERNQLIYEAIRSLNMADNPVDMLTVINELERSGNLEKVGGPIYISELTTKVASSANIEYHARIVAQKYLARQLQSFGSTIQTKSSDATVDVDILMQEANSTLYELSKRNIRKEYTKINTAVLKTIENIEAAAACADGITGIASGFQELDDITKGWQPSDLIIIAGRPAMGKTSFGLSMAKNIVADYRVPAAFFSLEMSNEQLAARLISNVCEIEGEKIISGQLYQADWDRLDKRVDNLLNLPLIVDDTPGLTVAALRAKARRMVGEEDVKIIFVDYLQLLDVQGVRYNNRQEKISTISEQLKNLAKELNIPVIALCQLNRAVENREGLEGKRPRLSDLRESGAIEQNADVVVFVHRPEYYGIHEDDKGRDLSGLAQIIIAKHRKGRTDEVLLTFRGEFTRFENLEDNQFKSIQLEEYE